MLEHPLEPLTKAVKLREVLVLQDLHRAGATICMVTHDPRFARHAGRSIHLFDGRVVEEEKGEERAHSEEELKESGYKVS